MTLEERTVAQAIREAADQMNDTESIIGFCGVQLERIANALEFLAKTQGYRLDEEVK